MDKVQFIPLPLEIERHLMRRLRQRGEPDAAEALRRIAAWIDTEPEAPDGDWWKDFGKFKLCGTGKYPKTLLDPDMKPYGEEID